MAVNCFEDKASVHRLMRHTNAAFVLAYVGLGKCYTEKNFLRLFNEIHQLLTEEEYERILEIGPDSGGKAYTEVISWALNDAREATKHDNTLAMAEFRSQILRMRGLLGSLYDYDAQPVWCTLPFLHIYCALHFVRFMYSRSCNQRPCCRSHFSTATF